MIRIKYPTLNFDAKNHFENNVSLIVKYCKNYNMTCMISIIYCIKYIIFQTCSVFRINDLFKESKNTIIQGWFLLWRDRYQLFFIFITSWNAIYREKQYATYELH